jgi:hypothetical protein
MPGLDFNGISFNVLLMDVNEQNSAWIHKFEIEFPSNDQQREGFDSLISIYQSYTGLDWSVSGMGELEAQMNAVMNLWVS